MTQQTDLADKLVPLSTRSLLLKFLVRILPPLIVATTIFIIFFGLQAQKEYHKEIDHDVATFATSLTRVLDNLMWHFQTEELESALETISSNPAMVGAKLYDDKGVLFLTYGTTKHTDEAPLHSVTRDIIKDQPDGSTVPLGKLEIYYSYTHSYSQFKEHVTGQIFPLLLILLVICITGAYAFQSTIGLPLKRLLHAIRLTHSSDKWVQADWQSKDEIGEVITAHNQMIKHIAEKEAALSDSEKRYRELFDNALVGIFQIRGDGTLVNCNLTMARILGTNNVDDLLKDNASNYYINIEDRETLWILLRTKGSISNYRTQLKKVDGGRAWVELTGSLTPDDSFSGIMQDVTPQMEGRKALEERDELHRAFFEENKAVMLLHDPLDSSIQFVNPAACNYYGYSEDELTNMTTYDLNCMTDEEIFEELKQSTSERRPYFKHIHTLKDGSQRNVEVFTGPVSLGRRQLHYSIIHDVTEKRRLESKLERMATRDQLTGAYNRHAFFSRAKEEIARSVRFKHPMAVLMCDLDHFKKVNDNHGHAAGDEVLRTFALRCRAGLRQSDIFARIGGEEFAILLVETNEERALEVAERIRITASDTPIPTEKGDIVITASIGVTSLIADDTVTSILKRADTGLYKAKETGRNKVTKA